MIQKIKEWIESVGLSKIVWCTDLDKTLASKSSDPNTLTMPLEAKQNFYSLTKLTEDKLFIVTGRELEVVDKLFKEQTLKVSSEYNNITRFDLKKPPYITTFLPDWCILDEYFDQFLTQIHPQIVVRKKPIMRSIHYRLVPSQLKLKVEKQLYDQVTNIISKYNNKFQQELIIQDGGEALDIGPYPSCKSRAIEAILDKVNSDTEAIDPIPIYFGDSPGDIEAGMYVQKCGGKFIVVGPNKKVQNYGDFFLNSPEEYYKLLQLLTQS